MIRILIPSLFVSTYLYYISSLIMFLRLPKVSSIPVPKNFSHQKEVRAQILLSKNKKENERTNKNPQPRN